ncbi:MAG TPA: class I SAM-dependent methyltransferase [Gemmatimonadaceae bacterium]|nr:class I SAM-dependent methyltransferase [Gemmatimonadaceae bacterium]
MLPLAIIVALSAALVITTRKWLKAVAKRRAEGFGRPWRIRRVPLADLDPIFVPDAIKGYGPDTEVVFTSRVGSQLGATSNYEAWILAALARRSTTMFEFGTATGRTAYLWARNAPSNACVYTLTLPPDGGATYTASRDDDPDDERLARHESTSQTYVYSGTDVESHIVQLYGDSKAFDETPYAGRCDLIFVDGSHAYSYTVSDSAKALRMLRPGGLVLWHDYVGGAGARGCYRALNELAADLPLAHIAGTTLVAYRAPVFGSPGA